MKSRQVSWSALGGPISFQKSFRISPDQRSGRGVPLNTLFTRKGPSPTLTEKRQSARSARQTDNLAQNSSRQRMTPLQDLEIKKFPRHKSALWKTYRAAERNQAAARSSSRIDAVDQSWKRYRVPDMVEPADPGDEPFKAHPKPRVGHTTILPQIQIPPVALRIKVLLPHPTDKSIILLNPLPPTSNLAITLRRQHINRHRNLRPRRIRLMIERLGLHRIPRHKERPVKMLRQQLLLLIAQIITPLYPRPLSTHHPETLIIRYPRKRRHHPPQVLQLSPKQSQLISTTHNQLFQDVRQQLLLYPDNPVQITPGRLSLDMPVLGQMSPGTRLFSTKRWRHSIDPPNTRN